MKKNSGHQATRPSLDSSLILESPSSHTIARKVHELQDSMVYTNVQARRQKQITLRKKLSLGPGSLAADTWDSKHLDKFVAGSIYSSPVKIVEQAKKQIQLNNSHCSKQSNQPSYYFRTTPENKNTSHIGYTKCNPLVSNISTHVASLDKIAAQLDRTNQQESTLAQYKYPSESIKYKPTNPINFLRISPQPQPHLEYKKIRLLNLIQKRYPHGIIGVDNPESESSILYPSNRQQIRIRQQPNSHREHFIDPTWKSKRRIDPEPVVEKRERFCLRRLSNNSRCSYNILSNRQNQ